MAKKKAQIVDHSTGIKESSKIVALYPDIFTFKEKPVSLAHIERLMEDWREWVKHPRSLRIKQFWNEKGIPPRYLDAWKEKFPVVKETHAYVKECLADKRDIGALFWELDGAHVRYSFWQYDEVDKDFIAWKAQLARDNDKHSGTVNVTIERYPSTDEVPEKVKDE